MNNKKAIDYFLQNHWLTPLQERVSLKARKRMYLLWKGFTDKGPLRICDIGATPDQEKRDSNCFLKWLIEDQHQVFATSPEDISNLTEVFAQLHLLEKLPFNSINQTFKPWPFADKQFDWSFSSAVLEHAGSEEQQLFFIKECARISQHLFLTTPHRFHWLEFHTKLPFIHWLPKIIHRAILKLLGLKFWSREENLNLLSPKDLESLARRALGDDYEIKILKIWTLGMPSNLLLIAKSKKNSLP